MYYMYIIIKKCTGIAFVFIIFFTDDKAIKNTVYATFLYGYCVLSGTFKKYRVWITFKPHLV